MDSLTKKILIEYEFEYKGELYKGVNIYPKILTEKSVSEFTPYEKKKLTRKGFRWYIYFSFRHPETGKFVRQKPRYFNINQDYPSFKKRYHAIHLFLKAVKKHLADGYNPYEEIEVKDEVTTSQAFEKALRIRENTMSAKSYKGFLFFISGFEKYLRKNGLWNKPVELVKKKVVVSFLNHKMQTSTKATRNTYKANLSSLFTAMEDLELIDRNFIKNIPNEKVKPKAHKTYTREQVEKIFNYLETNDPTLLFYIKFFSYCVIRPVEANRIKVKDVNLKDRFFYLDDGKKIRNKEKSIPKLLLEEFPALELLDGEMYLFGQTGFPAFWDADELQRRNTYTRRFRKVKKHFGLPMEFTMFGFRPTIISFMFNRLLKETNSLEKALEETQKITEHRTRESLLKYLREINALKREDYSRLL